MRFPSFFPNLKVKSNRFQIFYFLPFLETADHENTMMRKAKNIIKSKVNKIPLHLLLKDEDFIESVFFRFALMDFPLRAGNVYSFIAITTNIIIISCIAEDLDVYRGYQASRKAKSLLENLASRRPGKKAEKRRPQNIKTRRQLQKLLKSVS